MPDLGSFSADQRNALRMAATALHDEFGDSFSTETIERFLDTSYDQFADVSTVHNFLPLMAERFARQRLRALAHVEGAGTDGTPIVLFLCVHNAGRSQMALGWFNHLAEGRAVAWSGGSEPGTEINPAAVAAMAEVDIEITAEFPKPWTAEIVQAADVVITMGCGDACPLYPGKRYEDWDLDDPAGQHIDAVRLIHDQVHVPSRELARLADGGPRSVADPTDSRNPSRAARAGVRPLAPCAERSENPAAAHPIRAGGGPSRQIGEYPQTRVREGRRRDGLDGAIEVPILAHTAIAAMSDFG